MVSRHEGFLANPSVAEPRAACFCSLLRAGILSRVIKLRRGRFEQGVPDNSGPLKLVIMSATLQVRRRVPTEAKLERASLDPFLITNMTTQVDTFAQNTNLFGHPPPVLKVDARQFAVTTHFDRRTPDDHVPTVSLA